MGEVILTALLGLWILSAAVGVFGAGYFAWQVRHFARLRFALPDPAPRAVVIVPLKGAPAYAEHALRAILAQEYPRFRLVVAVEAEADPAYRLGKSLMAQHGARIALVVAGPADQRGQKVHNLLTALAASPHEEIVCFADADALWAPDTLATLVRELSAWDKPVVLSAYRWMYPAPSLTGAVWTASANLALATIAKSPSWDIAWGGTMAAKRSTLERVGVTALWERSLSDDVPLSRALRRRGCHVKLMPNLTVSSPCDFNAAGALAFARRQYAMLRVYAPCHWLFSLAVYAVFFAGLGAAIAAFARPGTTHLIAMTAAGCSLAFLRGLLDTALVFSLRPRGRRMAWPCALDTVLPFVPALLHAYGLATTLVVHKVRWSGITYTLDRGRVTRIER